ncbi:MAG: hypothetical protein ABI678_28150 [Kofleriaceae bacterium]
MSAERMIRLSALWGVIAIAHALAAGYAWHMLAHGFAVGHPRFWVNEVVPVALVVIGSGCVVALRRRREQLAAFAIAMLASLHAGMAAAWAIVFPITGSRPAQVSAVIAAVLVALAAASLYRARAAWRAIAAGALVGLVAGGAIPRAQRGPDPGTHPAGPVRELGRLDPAAAPAPGLPAWAELAPEAAAIRIRSGEVELALQPLLTFYSRSPDRGWTVFASTRDRIGPERHHAATNGDTSYYAGDEPASLRVTADDALHLDAQSVLASAVYAHLDSFCILEVRGHHHLFVAFSPMPDQRIEVTYSEYPTGRPSRFAYLDADAVLHVVEATSGEKGPFHELAHGPLPAAAPLGLTLFDDEQPIAHLDLADFAAQASTQPSPTAGWGVPENAIEFSLGADRPDAAASFFITLAATSVGRGWDSVGHAPGLYRNRIDVRRGP